MKKLLLNLTIVLCTAITAFAQNVNIPDATFKAYLVGRTDSINTNKDNEISVQEAEAYTGRIDLRNKSNINLTGIEAFKNITFLRTSYYSTSKINVTQNTKLKYLDISVNYDFTFTHIDVSKNTDLIFLNIDSTRINQLDVSKNLKLKKLWTEQSSIPKLDVSNNLQLEELITIVTPILYLNLKNNINLKKINAQYGYTRLICVPNLANALSNPNFIYDKSTKITENCPIQGNFAESPIDINNAGYSLNLNSLYKGRSFNVRCETKSTDINTVEIYSTFNAKAVNTKIQIEVSNPNLETSLELIDTLSLDAIYTGQQCLNYTTVGNSRIYTIPNLTIGQKYIFRLEIGGTSQLGYSRTETIANTINVQLDPSVTGIDSDELLNQNKTLQSIYNLQGIEVDKNYNGLVIYRYTDGTTQKVMQ